MNLNRTNLNTNDGELPEDLLGVAGGLDALGASERASIDAGFEARLAKATASSLAAAPLAQSTQLRLVETRAQIARHTARRLRTNAAMAAGLLLAVSAGLAVWGVNWGAASGVGAVAAANEGVENVLAAVDLMDSSGWAAQVELLSSDTDRVRDALPLDWDVLDATDFGGGG